MWLQVRGIPHQMVGYRVYRVFGNRKNGGYHCQAHHYADHERITLIIVEAQNLEEPCAAIAIKERVLEKRTVQKCKINAE